MKNIQQNHAPKRVAAALIDWCIVAVWCGCLFLLASSRVQAWFHVSASRAELSGFVLLTLPLFLYLTLAEAIFSTTIGKKLLGLKVIATHNRRPATRQILIRNLVKLLPWELAHFSIWHGIVFPHDRLHVVAYAALLGSYALAGMYLYGLFSAKDRTLYDHLSNTWVVPA